ncbi:UNVERIFIED_CONTAM: hypothetical protein PYX00_009519 [Menopon gallinae]|uniref:Helicase ATP-binding domain-containing protein n=1 Tax=Menopon gallinae TaxID=328185 RepID=A0AAW2HBX4_9NEOP
MGVKKKRFNWKARENRKVIIDNTSSSKIKLDFGDIRGKYDECNQLVLPSEKRPTKKQKEQGTTKILSKKQRKRLEKVIEKKKKKADRTSLLEALANVQTPAEELNSLTTVASIQTKGLKRHFMEMEKGNLEEDLANIEKKETVLNSIGGSKRKKRILNAILSKNKQEESVNDPNIVGMDDSASSADDSDDGGDDEVQIKEEVLENEDEEVEEVDGSGVKDVEIVEECVEIKQEDDKDGKTEKSEENSQKNEVAKPQQKTVSSKPAVYVSVFRSPEIQEARLKLPILAEEQVVMEVINENDVVIVAGETGSGKTTQVPQFLYEAGYARDGKIIGITQPRRVAAISMAKRVAEEMNLGTDEVSYLIRFEGNVTPQTKIKYMTDGVLLKEIQTDFMLSKYSVILLDEAHERNVYTDILIGLLSRIVPLRRKKENPLKLIIMSATLRVEDFTENTRLFKTAPPIVKVESRQYPVSIHFNRRTPADYLKECFYKTCKIHTKPPGGRYPGVCDRSAGS